jgi:hypothetical protein
MIFTYFTTNYLIRIIFTLMIDIKTNYKFPILYQGTIDKYLKIIYIVKIDINKIEKSKGKGSHVQNP